MNQQDEDELQEAIKKGTAAWKNKPVNFVEELRGGMTPMEEREYEHKIAFLESQLAASEDECMEQARLNGMGAEREADLLGKVERLNQQVTLLSGVFSKEEELNAQIEQLNALVAKHYSVLDRLMDAASGEDDTEYALADESANRCLNDTEGLVSAWTRERDAKVLEDAASWFVFYGPKDSPIEADDIAARELRRMASELRGDKHE